MRQILIIWILVIFSSCAVEKEQIGNYNTQKGKSIVYKKGKDVNLFWDKVSIKRFENKIDIEDYEKVTGRNIFDNVVYYGTMGIFSFYTVKIITKEIKKEENNNSKK